MKKMFLAGCIILCALMVVGCGLGLEHKEDPEQEDLPMLRMGTDTVFYPTLAELVENCPSAYVGGIMANVNTEGMDDISYYITYYHYDEDKNFPIAVIAFMDQDVRYYFSGAVQDSVYADFATDNSLTYGGVESHAYVYLLRQEELIGGSSLHYRDDDSTFALSMEYDAPVPLQTYLSTLSKITGDQYKPIGDDVTNVRDDIVSICFISYDISEPKYRVNGDDILSEESIEFSPAEEEIVVFTSEPGENGADMVQYPAALYLDMAVIGEGKASIELLGDAGDILYTVSIESGADGVFISE